MGLDTKPTPVSAAFNVAGLTWSVTFNQPLPAGPLNVGNWTMRATNDDYNAVTAVAAGNVVSGTAVLLLPGIGPDEINYAPPPFDVTSLLGLPADAFAGFPLVVT